MTEFLTHAVQMIAHTLTSEQMHLPLMMVACYGGGSLVLYGLTRGREFLLAGISSVLFLVPFM